MRLFGRVAGRWRVPAGLAVGCLATIGCSTRPPTGTVDGVVRVGDRPGSMIKVVLAPDRGVGNTSNFLAFGMTDRDGRFKLACDRTGSDGVEVGHYRVCLVDLSAVVITSASQQARSGRRASPPAGDAGDNEAEAEAPAQAASALNLPPEGWGLPHEYNDPYGTPVPPFEVKAGHQRLEIDVPATR